MRELSAFPIAIGFILLLVWPFFLAEVEYIEEKEVVEQRECYETNFRFSDRLVYCTDGYYHYLGRRDSVIDAKIDSVLSVIK